VPLAVYIASGDHLPLKLSSVRQLIGPAGAASINDETALLRFGNSHHASAFPSTSAGTEPPLSIAVRTLVPLRMVSSSFVLSAPQAGAIIDALA
jgi:hypothetical protein